MPEIISIVGNSGSGKTTLMVALIAELKERGFRIGTIKHTHHAIEVQSEKKDTARHQAAGADTVILADPHGILLMRQCDTSDPLRLKRYFSEMDLVITEGYKSAPCPKVEVFREKTGKPPLFPEGGNGLVAFASDGRTHLRVPTFSINDARGIADFIESRFIRNSDPVWQDRP